MDQPVITETRESVPDWASPGTARQVANEALSGEPKLSDKQREFLKDLLNKKDLTGVDEGKLDLIWKCLRISEDPEEYGMSKAKASELIGWLLKRKDLPRAASNGNKVPIGVHAERLAVGVPAGRYAVESNAGELRFYKVWVSRDKTRLNLYVEHGPSDSDLGYQKTVMTILEKIKAAGIRQCAIRYGMEIGECSNCGLRLTNRISRELGIGPVCGGRMFGDDFKDEVKQKKAEIRARGENPDEKLFD